MWLNPETNATVIQITNKLVGRGELFSIPSGVASSINIRNKIITEKYSIGGCVCCQLSMFVNFLFGFRDRDFVAYYKDRKGVRQECVTAIA